LGGASNEFERELIANVSKHVRFSGDIWGCAYEPLL